MKCKHLAVWLCLAILALSGSSNAITTTVTFKPNATTGEDAVVTNMSGCTPAGSPGDPANFPNGNSTQLDYFAWTFNAVGCPSGTARSYIRFTQINTAIPPGAVITNAVLKLYGVPTSGLYGNSTYPGSPYPATNPGWLLRIDPAAPAWNENTVTWNNFTPAFIGAPIPIPVSTSRWNWNVNLNVTNFVSDIYNGGPAANNGFMLRLQTEAIYRGVIFASSDHANPRLWPELEVTYELPCTDPQADFTYCHNSASATPPPAYSPTTFNFSANNTGLPATYNWYVNGTLSGTGTTYSHTFPVPAGAAQEATHEVILVLDYGNGYKLCRKQNICIYKTSLGGAACAQFTACFNTANPNTVQVQANSPGLPGPYEWNCAGSVAYGPSATFSVPPSSVYGIDLEVGTPPNTCYGAYKYCSAANMLIKGETTPPVNKLEQELQVRVVPNPVSGNAIVKLSQSYTGPVQLKITDLAGKIVQREQLIMKEGGELSLSTGGLPKGMYVLELSHSKGSAKCKFVKW